MPNKPHTLSFAYPVLLADIGGTNCRLAIIENADAPVQPLAHIPSNEISDLPTRLRGLCAGKGVQSALLAVAGVVNGRRMTLTNLPWSIDAADIGHTMALQSVLLINDFEAQAAATTAFAPHDCLELQRGSSDAAGTRLIVGAGTGFGAAFLRPHGDGFCLVPSEAGHMELPLAAGDETLFADSIRARQGRVTIEEVIAGPGLARLDQALHPGRAPRDAAAIAAAAHGKEAQALMTIQVWQRLLAASVANLVIAAKATGGAWIAGGVITHLLPWIDRSAFLAAFTRWPPMTELLRQTQLRIVMRKDSAFPGLAAIAATPERFGLMQPAGLWRA